MPALPALVEATRPNARVPWRRGADRRSADAHWFVTTADEVERRRGNHTLVRFDVPLAPGATLADPAFATDAAIRRVLCVCALELGFGNGPLGIRPVASALLRLDWQLRWRHDRGVQAVSDLRPTDLRDHATRLAAGGGALGSINLTTRLALVDDESLAVVVGVGTDPLLGADLPGLARLLGVPRQALSDRPALLDHALRRRLGEPCMPQNPAAPPSVTTLSSALAVWAQLRFATECGLLGRHGLDFAPGRQPTRLARRLGKPKGRTPTLEPPTFVRLLAAAACVVLVRGPAVVGLVGSSQSSGTFGRSEVERDVRRVLAAVAVLIGGFAARRGGEVTGVRRRALRSFRGGDELRCPIEKSTVAVAWVEVPRLVATAVRTAEALAEAAGDSDGPWLLRVRLAWGAVVDVDPAADLASFAAACGWWDGAVSLASHQLRRAAALLWEFGYVSGTPAGLAQLLRHEDERSGTTYVTEAVPGAVCALGDRLAAARAVEVAAIGQEQAGRLLALRERLGETSGMGACVAEARRYGDLPFRLLDGWARSRARGVGSARPDAALRVCVGSQATDGEDSRPALLDAVRAHAAALARSGLLA